MANLYARAKEATEAASGLVNDAVALLDKREAGSHETEDRDPTEMLNEIALDDELQSKFAPVLKDLGFEINAEEAADSMGDIRKITIARRRTEIAFYVACIPKSILEDPSKRNRAAFNFLQYLFTEGSVAYIISPNLWSMDPDFEPLLTGWKSKPIYASFVPWNYVTKFLNENNPQKKLLLMKTTMLKLNEFLTRTQPPPASAPTELKIDEKEEVIDMMSKHATLPSYDEPKDFFSDLASSVELPGREELEWKGNPRVVARRLLDHAIANPYPDGHERARQKTLGWLLATFAKYQMPPQSQDTLIALVLIHNLIGDPEKIEELRRRVPNPTEVLNARAKV